MSFAFLHVSYALNQFIVYLRKWNNLEKLPGTFWNVGEYSNRILENFVEHSEMEYC